MTTTEIENNLLKLNENKEEQQYLDLVQNIIANGTLEEGRNGNTYAIFGNSMRFSLQNGQIPILTTKKLAWKTCLRELLWFIKGSTNNDLLVEQGVHIWDGNASRNFLDDRGLTERREGDLGPIYGHQWRHFNAAYQDCDTDYSGQGVDQLQNIIDQLKNPATRNSRRLVMSAWNPCQLDEVALPPCHILSQFNVHGGNKLSCALFQRSNDEALGTPFNIASYCFLTHLIANHCGLEAHEFVYFKGNCHIYEEHVEGMKTQLARKPHPFPTVTVRQVRDNIDDYTLEDFELHNYVSHPQIKFKMVV
jgi:thymidylate synthase